MSGYFTIATALSEHARREGVWTAADLRAMHADALADVLGQRRDHELMALYAQSLRALGQWLGDRATLDVVAAAGGSSERFAEGLARGMAMYADRGFYKRAQIAASDLALAGVATFTDLARLTIFADNLVPHVLRCDGVLVYDDRLAAHVDAERPLRYGGPQEREIRGCAVHAAEQLAARLERHRARARPLAVEPRAGPDVQGPATSPVPLRLLLISAGASACARSRARAAHRRCARAPTSPRGRGSARCPTDGEASR